MIVMIEDRSIVEDAYRLSFQNFGIKLECFQMQDFLDWSASIQISGADTIEAILIGNCSTPSLIIRKISKNFSCPIIALIESSRLDEIIGLFENGADDVIRKPMHIREILCRINSIRRRKIGTDQKNTDEIEFQIFYNGRDAIVGGRPLVLPRRERRLLEYFAANMGKRISKEQLFNAVYGIFEDGISETVIESHISKLRRKLRDRLGFDPITSQRYLGYLFSIQKGSYADTHFESTECKKNRNELHSQH